MASADSVKGMVEIAAEEGIDILVNNAGILRAGSVVSTSEADWDQVINVNLRNVYLCSKYALPHIAKRTDGAVVNIASVAGLDGLRDSAVCRPDSARHIVSIEGLIRRDALLAGNP